jgi:hypothetical protein
MRDHFYTLYGQVVAHYLHGISAFGSRVRFYKYTLAANSPDPVVIPADPTVINDFEIETRWDCDIFDANGLLVSERLLTPS